MTERYDLLAVRESNGKAYFTKCGAMFPNKNGDGFNIICDVFPAPTEGQFRLIAKVPQPRDDRERSANADRQQARERSQQSSREYLDDDLPPF